MFHNWSWIRVGIWVVRDIVRPWSHSGFFLVKWKWFSILQWGWRCRAKLAVRGSASDPLIGLYEEGTHNVVDIPDCKGN